MNTIIPSSQINLTSPIFHLQLQSEIQVPQTTQQHTEISDELEVCLNQLVGIYGYMPLLYTQFRADSLLSGTSSASNSEKCFHAV